MITGQVITVRERRFFGALEANSPIEHALGHGLTPEQLFQFQDRLIKVDNGIRTALLRLPQGLTDGQEWVLFAKEYAPRRPLHFLRVWLHRERAPRVWHIARYLMAAGVPVARPLAYFIQKTTLDGRKGYYFSEALLGCRDLRTIAGEPSRFQELMARGDLIEDLATGIAAFHKTGASHGDMKWGNIMIDEARGRFWFIDLDAARHRRFHGRYAMARDVARFVLNSMEAGLPKDKIEQFIASYALRRNLPLARVSADMAPILRRLQKRHQKKLATHHH